MALCVVCGFAYHKQHSTADIKDVAAEFRQQMTADVEDMNKGVVKLRNLLGDAEKHKSKFTKCAAKAETEINEKTEKAKQTIDRHRQTLVDELAAKQSEVNKQFDSLSDSTTQLLSFLENVIKYNEELSSKGTSCDIARHGLALHHRIQELLKFDDIESTCERIKSAEVNFVASPMISSSASNTVGKIEYKVSKPVRNTDHKLHPRKR
jgi:vacuolar-type H+-ATPase subunit I/STV1